MDLGISGKKAIVCASSRGLGKGCATALAEAECHLIINGRDEQTLETTATELKSAGAQSVAIVRADVSTPEGQKELLKACPNPDILVNNNGGPPRKDYTELDRQAMLDGVIQNMITPIELIQAVLPGMSERGFGRIVNITSLSVYMPIEGLDLSSGARAGLTAFLAGVLRTVTHKNVTVNNILPGKIDTDRIKSLVEAGAKQRGISEAEELKMHEDAIPAKRLGTPSEFGNTCAFLCSQHAGYITGQNIKLDGGLYTSSF
jgi:3-oxoacyl-[acyl-carrier protein] reductase